MDAYGLMMIMYANLKTREQPALRHCFITPADPWQDLERDYGKNGYKRMVALKTRYPHLKVTIAIGGWNEGSLKYSMLAEDPEKRAKFVRSVLHFLE